MPQTARDLRPLHVSLRGPREGAPRGPAGPAPRRAASRFDLGRGQLVSDPRDRRAARPLRHRARRARRRDLAQPRSRELGAAPDRVRERIGQEGDLHRKLRRRRPGARMVPGLAADGNEARASRPAPPRALPRRPPARPSWARTYPGASPSTSIWHASVGHCHEAAREGDVRFIRALRADDHGVGSCSGPAPVSVAMRARPRLPHTLASDEGEAYARSSGEASWRLLWGVKASAHTGMAGTAGGAPAVTT